MSDEDCATCRLLRYSPLPAAGPEERQPRARAAAQLVAPPTPAPSPDGHSGHRPTVTQQRQGALISGLESAAAPSTVDWLQHRMGVLLAAAKLPAMPLYLSRDDYAAAGGPQLPAHVVGDAAHRLPAIFVDPTYARNRGDADRLLAHEVAHHRWPSYGHKAVFFRRCQRLLDLAAHDRSHQPLGARIRIG